MNLVFSGWLLRSHTLHNHALMHFTHPHPHTTVMHAHCTPTCPHQTPTHAYPHNHAYPHMHITHSSISENKLLLLEKGRICAGQGYGQEFWDCPGCFGTFHNYHTHMAIVLLHCKAILGCFNLIPCQIRYFGYAQTQYHIYCIQYRVATNLLYTCWCQHT